MAVAILHRGGVVKWPIHDWLADAGEELHLFTAVPRPDQPRAAVEEAFGRYASVHLYERMDRNVRPDLDILELAERRPLSGLVCIIEWDLERAGALRDRLGLPGQGHASALAYRDKALMKDLLRARGVPVTPHRRVTSVLDVVDHVQEHGYPIVVKPLACGGAMDVHVIRDDAELAALADGGLSPRVEIAPHYIVESFVPGTEYIVDGLVVDGRMAYCWPSCYFGTTTSFTGTARQLGAALLDVDHPLRARLREMAVRTVEALPSPSCFPFHAEIFHTPDDRLVVGEIGARAGGGRIDSMCHRVFGVNPHVAMARSQAGLDPQVPLGDEVELVRRLGVHGWIMYWAQPGRARRLPPAPTKPWIRDWRLDAAIGQVLRPPSFSGEFFGSAVVAGRSFAEVEARIGALSDWFWSHTEIEPLPAEPGPSTGPGSGGPPAGQQDRAQDRDGGASGQDAIPELQPVVQSQLTRD